MLHLKSTVMIECFPESFVESSYLATMESRQKNVEQRRCESRSPLLALDVFWRTTEEVHKSKLVIVPIA